MGYSVELGDSCDLETIAPGLRIAADMTASLEGSGSCFGVANLDNLLELAGDPNNGDPRPIDRRIIRRLTLDPGDFDSADRSRLLDLQPPCF